MKIFRGLFFISLFYSISVYSESNTENAFVNIELDNPNIMVSGSNYTQVTKDTVFFQRFSDKVLSMSLLESKLNAVRAHTTTGIVVSFITSSPSIQLQFTVMEGENRGHNFAVFQDSVFIKEFSFSKTSGPDLVLDIVSQNLGDEVLYEISLPNWSITSLTGLKLEEGYVLSVPNSLNKPVYVAYGNSITHGTGQAGTHKTYPFLFAKELDYELYNVAVGGSKTSVAVSEMLRDDFEHIDVMTMLIGYNDFNGEGIDTVEYRSRYLQFLKKFREAHNSTLIYCLSMTYTTNYYSVASGIPAIDFRAVVRNIVAELNAEGDENIFFIEGDEISSEINLKDAVHFTEDGALLFAEDLAKAINNSGSDPDPNPSTSVSLADSPYDSIKLLYEPGFSSLYIESEIKIDSISVYSLDGKLLFSSSCWDHRVDISSISQGNYILQMEFISKDLRNNYMLFSRI